MKNIAEALSSSVLELPWTESISVQTGGEPSDPYYLSDKEAGTEILYGKVHYKSDAGSFGQLSAQILSKIELNQGELSVHPPSDPLSGLLGLKPGRETWTVSGHSPEEARASAEMFVNAAKEQNWTILPSGRKPGIVLYPDREKLAQTGLDVSMFSQSVGSSLFGSIQSSVFIDGRDVDIKVQLNRNNRNSVNKLSELNLSGRNSELFKLDELVMIEEEFRLPYLSRTDRKDVSELVYSGRHTREAGQKLMLSGLRSTDQSLIRENLVGIITIFTLSLILLYLTLGAQFESFSLPLLLMLALPLGFSGITAALLVGRAALDLNSVLGILVLMGISVNNSILLYETFQNELKSEGCTILGAIYRGTVNRIRPIMMTMLTTTLALIPLAVDPFGTSTQSSMALAIIGGLTISTVLSLLVIPKVFYLYEKKRSAASVV